MRYAYLLIGFLSLSFAQEAHASNPTQIPNRVTASEAVSAKWLVKRISPVYPRLAQGACIQGNVSLSVTVAADGSVKSANAISGPVELREAAEQAVMQWEYAPYLLNGKPVEWDTKATVHFRLPPALCAPTKT